MAILEVYILIDKKCIKFRWVNIRTDQLDSYEKYLNNETTSM